jgi:hypothetical protein
MQERFVLLEGVPAGGLGAAQGCLHSALGAWRPAPSVRGTAQRGMGTATPGCLLDPLCHRLLPLPRGTFSEMNGHVESIFVRLYRFYTIETIESRAKEWWLHGERAQERRWHMRSSSRSFAPYRRATFALVGRSTQWLPRLQSRCNMSESVPAPLSPLRHAVGWESCLASCLLGFV